MKTGTSTVESVICLGLRLSWFHPPFFLCQMKSNIVGNTIPAYSSPRTVCDRKQNDGKSKWHNTHLAESHPWNRNCHDCVDWMLCFAHSCSSSSSSISVNIITMHQLLKPKSYKSNLFFFSSSYSRYFSTTPFFFLFKNCLFLWKSEWQRGGRERGARGEREKEKKRGVFFLLVHSPNMCKSWGWARLKPGAQKSIWIFYVGGRDSNTWAIFHDIPKYICRKLPQKQRSWDSNQTLQDGM